MDGKLVLRHNKDLQYGYNISNETLASALLKMQEYCKTHPKGNPKLTGFIKMIENTRLNNAPLSMKLTQLIYKGVIPPQK